ncbi:MAG: vWA domain-containing protein, partial [Pseudobacter sp.]|uniref:vWA domain-containing protein n=1 Tax=Pseudobacter sp. TaxID=2045420 RepID=UPI003F7D30DC
EVVVMGYSKARKQVVTGSAAVINGVSISRPQNNTASLMLADGSTVSLNYQEDESNTEEYDAINETGFQSPFHSPLSTFSIDVDAASYSNIRRFITQGSTPPKDAIRIEEMINYFDYDYPQPTDNIPFSVITELGAAPWNPKHKLLHIGLQGIKMDAADLPASNLVFLIDVSGSMEDPNKLPLLKSSFRLLIDQLRPQDHIAIVVYAGAAGLVLEPTSGNEKMKILEALDKLQAGGSTAGGAGIQLAYATAKKYFREGGNNRVILATDGDFNVGVSDNSSMQRLIEEKRQDGIFLTVLGFGMGNYKDSKMEILADKGNGNYAYIDNISEARKVLVKEFGSTLFTIAKDVKLQLEFNPAKVKGYRLIGYENRMLRAEDFKNDKKDAGELGAGHTVTALYEIIPAGVNTDFPIPDKLKYQNNKSKNSSNSNELVTVKLRYKKPAEDKSQEISFAVKDEMGKNESENFRWSAAVAEFGMILRKSEYAQQSSLKQVLTLAKGAVGKDADGYRKEFIQLVQQVTGKPISYSESRQ